MVHAKAGAGAVFAALVAGFASPSADAAPAGLEGAARLAEVRVEPDRRGLVVLEDCPGESAPLSVGLLLGIGDAPWVGRIQDKGAVIGENRVSAPDWSVSAFPSKSTMAAMIETVRAGLEAKKCRAVIFIGAIVEGSWAEPSGSDRDGAWAIVMQDLAPGGFPDYRDYLLNIQPLYDQHGFEDVAILTNISRIDVNDGIVDLQTPDVLIQSYIPFPRTAFGRYLADPRFPALDAHRRRALTRYISFSGVLEPRE